MNILRQQAEARWQSWLKQARGAIEQGYTLKDFTDLCVKSNRPIARRAYMSASIQPKENIP